MPVEPPTQHELQVQLDAAQDELEHQLWLAQQENDWGPQDALEQTQQGIELLRVEIRRLQKLLGDV